MDKKAFIILCGVFFIALFLRAYNLQILPFSLHTDELYAGYVGRYIFLHGKDIYGNIFPLYVNKFGDFRPIGIFWVSGLSTFIFGINEFAIRFPSALFGALTIFPLFLLTNQLLKNKKIALLASLLLALLPWHITLSRATSEAIVGLFFFVFSLYYMFLFIEKEKVKHIFFAVLLGLASYLFYHVYRLVLPIVFLPLPFFIKSTKIKRSVIFAIAVFSAITLGISLTNQGTGRFSQVAFYNNPSLPNTIEFLKTGEGSNNVLSARIFDNKAVVYGREFIRQYLSYFSSQFLFDDKGLPARYVTPEQGLLYYLYFPFLAIGLLFLLSIPEKKSSAWFLLYLLIIAVLPAALTNEDSPNISRSVVMIIPIVIVGAVGVYGFFTKIKLGMLKNPLLVLTVFIFLLECIYFWHRYSVQAKTYEPFYRNEGNTALVQYVIKNRKKYQHIYMPSNDDLPIYYLFYLKNFDYLKSGEIRKVESGAEFHGITFVSNLCVDKLFASKATPLLSKSLIISGGDCPDVGLTTKLIIVRSDGTKAYRIFATP